MALLPNAHAADGYFTGLAALLTIVYWPASSSAPPGNTPVGLDSITAIVRTFSAWSDSWPFRRSHPMAG